MGAKPWAVWRSSSERVLIKVWGSGFEVLGLGIRVWGFGGWGKPLTLSVGERGGGRPGKRRFIRRAWCSVVGFEKYPKLHHLNHLQGLCLKYKIPRKYSVISQLRDTFLGVPIIRSILFGGLH